MTDGLRDAVYQIIFSLRNLEGIIEEESKSSRLIQIENYLLMISLGILGSLLYVFFEQTDAYRGSTVLEYTIVLLIFIHFGYIVFKVLTFVLRENEQFMDLRFFLDRSYGISLFFFMFFIVVILLKIVLGPFISKNLIYYLLIIAFAIVGVIIWWIRIPTKIADYYVYLRSRKKPYTISHFPLTLLDVTELKENKVEVSLRNNTKEDLNMEMSVEIPPNVMLISIEGLEDAKSTDSQEFLFVLKSDTIRDVDILLKSRKKGLGEIAIYIRHKYYKDTILLKTRVLEVEDD
jgi:hypothetical protein